MTTRLASSKPFEYRPDIDGLRAVSVLLVLFFHAFPTFLPGGFVGVDIFFVISGYLISKIIFEDLEKNSFSFSDFYLRRTKRIFPALFPMLVCCYLFGWFALLASEYMQLGKHLAGGTAFISNFINWNEAGYFDNSAETKPLLHLWSLGIEEQFYLFWPLILWACWKRKIPSVWVILLLSLGSFLLNLKLASTYRIGVFFSPLTRGWELLAGSLLAWMHFYFPLSKMTPDVRPFQFLPPLLSAFGFLLLGYSLLNITRDLNYPGKWGLFPVLSAVCIIASGPHHFLNRFLLSNRLMVFLGLLSFPIYLWHWPLFSFAMIIEDGDLSVHLKLILIFFTLILSFLTYRIIETPVRFGGLKNLSWRMLSLPMLMIGLIGLLTYLNWGFSFRENSNLHDYGGDVGHLDFHRHVANDFLPCRPKILEKEALRWEGFVRCAQTKPSDEIDVALIGDSHAEHLFLGVAENLKDLNVAFYQRNSSAFISNPEFNNIFDFVSKSKTIKLVILNMWWEARLSGISEISTLRSQLDEIVAKLLTHGKTLIFTDDVPTFPFDAKRCKGKTWLSSKKPMCETADSQFPSRSGVSVVLKDLSDSNPNVYFVETWKYFCDGERCRMTLGDKLFFRDNNHLNIEGSLFLGSRIVEDNAALFKNITENSNPRI